VLSSFQPNRQAFHNQRPGTNFGTFATLAAMRHASYLLCSRFLSQNGVEFFSAQSASFSYLRLDRFHFIGVGTGFLGAHTPSASSKVARCIIRHARPSQLQSGKAAW
jgi:hypothetical protein